MSIFISEIHRQSGRPGCDIGFLEGRTADGQYVYVCFKYGYLSIQIAETEEALDQAVTNDEPDSFVVNERIWNGDYHISDYELVAVTRDDIRWPAGFGSDRGTWEPRW